MLIRNNGIILNTDNFKGITSIFSEKDGYLADYIYVSPEQLERVWTAFMENRRLLNLDEK